MNDQPGAGKFFLDTINLSISEGVIRVNIHLIVIKVLGRKAKHLIFFFLPKSSNTWIDIYSKVEMSSSLRTIFMLEI